MPTLSSLTKELIQRSGIRPRKRLGQHFLIDKDILGRILEAAELSKKDIVLEVGTGLGIFTMALADKVSRVITIEIDQKLLNLAKDFLKDYDNIQFVKANILKVDVSKLVKTKVKVVANLPYYITTPIISKLIKIKPKPSLLVFTVQREVAQRIVALPGGKDYSSFSVFIQYHTIPEIVSYVPKSAFLPRPEVSSAILKLIPRREPAVKVGSERLFFEIVRAAFGQRRKTLRNAILGAPFLKLIPQKLDRALAEAHIHPQRRGETLSLEEFAAICNVL